MNAAQTYDLVVYGGTPGGLACAIRAAREGLSGLLVTHTPHLGGMLTSGLCVWDTIHEGRRAPIYDELRAAILEHYRETYGETSEQYRAAVPGAVSHSNGNFEPRVAQAMVEKLVAAEPSIHVVRQHIPSAVSTDDRALCSVTFKEFSGAATFDVSAAIFADCSYEGDLMALAGEPYAVGRESRAAFNEPHAGRIFMTYQQEQQDPESQRLLTLQRALKLRQLPGHYGVIETEGSGRGDDLVQAYNWRTMLTADPDNRVPLPPAPAVPGVDLTKLDRPWDFEFLPNQKFRINRPQLLERQTEYVEGDWAARQRVMDEHWNAFLGIVHAMQNDPALKPADRERWQSYGLPKDEFADNGHRPYEIYARETRRLSGRYVFTEHDALLAPGLERTPVHGDSIAATEWPIDIHACTDQREGHSLQEGKTILYLETFPGQLSLRTILPPRLDNLLVPVCCSCTHVGWGTIRLEPTWMNIGESAGQLAAFAVKAKTPPARVDADRLQRHLTKSGVMLSYFSDVPVTGDDGWEAAMNYFGTKGFFAEYAARPRELLTVETGTIWAEASAALLAGKLEPMAVAKRIFAAGKSGAPMNLNAFRRVLPPELAARFPTGEQALARGRACQWLFESLPA